MGSRSSKQSLDANYSEATIQHNKKALREKRKSLNGGVSIKNNEVAGVGGGPGGPFSGGFGGEGEPWMKGAK